MWLLLAFLIGFGVKIPVFPLHGWLPLARVEAPSPVSILLSGVLLKMGAHGLPRVAPMLPEATVALQVLLAGSCIGSIKLPIRIWTRYSLDVRNFRPRPCWFARATGKFAGARCSAPRSSTGSRPCP